MSTRGVLRANSVFTTAVHSWPDQNRKPEAAAHGNGTGTADGEAQSRWNGVGISRQAWNDGLLLCRNGARHKACAVMNLEDHDNALQRRSVIPNGG